jgi:hypothetical protein
MKRPTLRSIRFHHHSAKADLSKFPQKHGEAPKGKTENKVSRISATHYPAYNVPSFLSSFLRNILARKISGKLFDPRA